MKADEKKKLKLCTAFNGIAKHENRQYSAKITVQISKTYMTVNPQDFYNYTKFKIGYQ